MIQSEVRTSKLLGLELIRFACAMTVLIFHYKHFALVAGQTANRGIDMPFALPLALIYVKGNYGVQVFWCISGFIFFWKYGTAIAARQIDPKRFFWLRFSRLYPLHFATLLIVAALQPIYVALAGRPFVYLDNSAVNFLIQLGLADQWAGSAEFSFNGPIWSVSAEVFVYVLFYVLLRGLGKSPWLIVGAIALSLASIWSGVTSPTLICGGYFFAGGAAALWLGSARHRQRPDESRRIALALIGACMVLSFFVDLGGSDGDPAATWLMAISPPILFLAAQDLPALDRWERQIQAAGNLTYSTYLIHFPLQLAIAAITVAAGIMLPISEPWFLFAYLTATLILGRIVFVRFEAPAQKMIRAATLARPERAAA